MLTCTYITSVLGSIHTYLYVIHHWMLAYFSTLITLSTNIHTHSKWLCMFLLCFEYIFVPTAGFKNNPPHNQKFCLCSTALCGNWVFWSLIPTTDAKSLNPLIKLKSIKFYKTAIYRTFFCAQYQSSHWQCFLLFLIHIVHKYLRTL